MTWISFSLINSLIFNSTSLSAKVTGLLSSLLSIFKGVLKYFYNFSDSSASKFAKTVNSFSREFFIIYLINQKKIKVMVQDHLNFLLAKKLNLPCLEHFFKPAKFIFVPSMYFFGL